MQVPWRKPGQYTHLKPDPNVSPAKFDELNKKLQYLYNVARPRTIADMQEQAKNGDFSENAAYAIAKGRLRGINNRILELESFINQAQIIEPAKHTGKVELGCTVTVKVDGKQKVYHILGSAETNPGSGVISNHSPLGAALYGRAVGDMVTVKLANKEVVYKIVKIE